MIEKDKYLSILSYLVENNLALLTSQDLKNCQINSYEINQLLKNEMFVRLQRGEYLLTPKAISNLYYLKDEVALNLSTMDVSLVEEKVGQLKENYEQFYHQMVLFSIQNEDYTKAWYYVSSLTKIDKQLYTYLLSFLMQDPFSYTRRVVVKGNLYEQFKVKYHDAEVGRLSNQIRYKIANEQFSVAIESLKQAMSKDYCVTTDNELTMVLLTKVQQKQEKLKAMLVPYLENENYDKVIEVLERAKESHKLTKVNTAVLLLSKDIKILQEEQKSFIKQAMTLNTDQFLTAIEGKDYPLAKRLIEKDAYYLRRMIPLYVELEKLLAMVTVQNNTLNKAYAKVTYQEMTLDLENHQLIPFYQKLRKYLLQLERTEYEQLVKDTIKLDVVNKNDHFIYTKNLLLQLMNEEYSFSLAEQLACFYQALIEQKYNHAKIYHSMIHRYPSITGNELECSKEINKLFASEVKKSFMNPYQPLTKKEQLLLQGVLDNLAHQGIYIFKSMANWQMNEIYQAINKLEGIYCFEIGPSYSRRIVAKTYTASADMDEVKDLMRIGEAMYQAQEYDFSIFAFQQALKVKSMDAWLYARLGIACKNKNMNDLAVTYLTIAEELTRNKTCKYDFSVIINALSKNQVGSLKEVTVTKKGESGHTMFKNAKEKTYGISHLHEVVYAIAKNMSQEEIKTNFSLTEEQYGIALLITAREYYYLGNDIMGDRYFNQVGKMKNKTKPVIDLFEEIRRKKRFFKNHEESTHQSLLEAPKQKILK